MYLTGAKRVKLDAKGRLTLPVDIRKECDSQVRLIPMPDALYGFTPEGFAAWMDGLFNEKFKSEHPNHVQMRRVMNGRTVILDIDTAGRIALGKVDAEQRKKLGISGEVIVSGMGDRFEVWNADEWEKINNDVTDDDLIDLMSSVDF